MTTPAHRRILDQITRRGPISFAEFMEIALYDPEGGYYARRAPHPAGVEGDFVTSPHVSPAFGTLLAGFATAAWDALGRPGAFRVVDVGAGDATLLRTIAGALSGDSTLGRAASFVAIERSMDAASASKGRSGDELTWAASLAELSPLEGVVLANELLDNLPFHRVARRADGEVREVLVGLDGDALTFVEGAPSLDAVRLAGESLAPGTERVVPTGAWEFVDALARTLRRGYAVLVDYAAPPGADARDAVHGYRRHRALADVLSHPGTQDITAGVDFDEIAVRARARGLSAWGPVSQRDLLRSLGFAEWDRAALSEQGLAQRERRGVDAARRYSERNAARLLVDPAGLGGFAVLCLGAGVNPDALPPGFPEG
ncbi:MAG TPA: SAM-dependent methyltransferase [Actinomycetota bacterium]|jgi:SAM-dependent MidA family methyltransferase